MKKYDQNIFVKEIFSKIFQFYNKHKNWIIGISATLGIIIAITIIFVIRTRQTREYVHQQIALSEGYLYRQNYVEAYKILDNIITHYKNTRYATYAMYLKANSLFENKEFNVAKDLCVQILKIRKPKTIITPSMYLLGQCYLALGNYEEAIKVFNEIIQNYANHFYSARVYESLAICYELKGDTTSAKSIYEKMNVLYPGSYWSQLAQQKISKL
ncbi:MAG: tetratricopeptide repeat protein [Endomicrobia bacterium]|nr:tetratricopeptide repeat protein [Endomicrobiia bacterium]